MKTIYGLIERYCGHNIVIILADNKYSCVQMLRKSIMTDIESSFYNIIDDAIEENKDITREELRELIVEDLWEIHGYNSKYSIDEYNMFEEGDEVEYTVSDSDWVDMKTCFAFVYESMDIEGMLREAIEESGRDEREEI